MKVFLKNNWGIIFSLILALIVNITLTTLENYNLLIPNRIFGLYLISLMFAGMQILIWIKRGHYISLIKNIFVYLFLIAEGVFIVFVKFPHRGSLEESFYIVLPLIFCCLIIQLIIYLFLIISKLLKLYKSYKKRYVER